MTGSNPWTLYEEENYEGKSVCFKPGGTDGSDGSPGFYGNNTEDMMKKASSVKKGCSGKILKRAEGKKRLVQ